MKHILWAFALLTGLALAMPAWAVDALDINAASVEQLQEIGGIGPKTAAAIVAYRQAHGQFKSVDELADVKGIGAKKLEKMQGQLSVGEMKEAKK